VSLPRVFTSLAIVNGNNNLPFQRCRGSEYRIAIVERRILIPTKRNIEPSLRVNAIQSIVASLVEEYRPGGSFNGWQVERVNFIANTIVVLTIPSVRMVPVEGFHQPLRIVSHNFENQHEFSV